MKSFSGTESELGYAMEKLYANDGRDFNPNMPYPPRMLYRYGNDYALHARGIYYRHHFSEDFVACNRNIWVRSLSENEIESPDTLARQSRAELFAKHSRNNENWCKSEYAWEADAWSDVFRPMRDDPCLAIDKHAYQTLLPDTDPILCKLTGESSFVKLTPDATFGLASFTERETELPPWTSDLLWDNLERLMLHPNYGLVSDPSRIETDIAFPFMVYEAKGWSGDCRVARRQACSAAAVYLDMLDELVRRPGPVGSPRPYQTPTSHHYQVFALTSFGAYWHLVGYRRPRLAAEYADETGMSETVYMFQRIWSGHVTDKKSAYELLDLLDQIHLWGITEYRTFVQDHLGPWNRLCQENYLLEWDSKYDLGEDKKRKRTYSETEDLRVPSWVNNMSEQSRLKFQDRARASLDEAIEEHRLIRGKSPCRGEMRYQWNCVANGCTTTWDSDAALVNHMQLSHGLEDRSVAALKRCLKRQCIMENIRIRQKQGIMATGHRWPGSLPDDDDDDAEVEIDFENVVSYDRLRARRRTAIESVSKIKSQ